MHLLGDILLIDKPSNMTSFGVVARVRRMMGSKKAGHAGTLDPLATGLLLVGIGTGTKKLASLTKLDKEYVAEILVGQKRTTGDMEGLVVSEREVLKNLPAVSIKGVFESLLGAITLPVSAYSAIKINGVPMYKRARAAERTGVHVEPVPARQMRVDEIELLSSTPFVYEDKQFYLVKARFSVGSGTYIRSLAEEFGQRLGYPATLYSLRRSKIGAYEVAKALTLEQLAKVCGTELY